jgi:RNA polymerase sigma-70 factor (ECF subfamily)
MSTSGELRRALTGFAKAVASRRRFRRTGSIEGWVWRIILNTAREARRRDARRDSVSEVHVVEANSLPDERARELRAELRELPERQRLAVFLHYFGDLPYDEVARLLDIAPGTVAASLNAARKTLRQRYLKEGYE